METIMINVNELSPHPRNREFFDDLSGEKWTSLLDSIRENGVKVPVLITQDNVIVSGHQRVRAALELGMTEIPANREFYANEDEILRDLIELNVCQRGTVDGTACQLSRRISELERIYGIHRGGDRSKAKSKMRELTHDELKVLADQITIRMPFDEDRDYELRVEETVRELEEQSLHVPFDTLIDSDLMAKVPRDLFGTKEEWYAGIVEYVESLGSKPANDGLVSEGSKVPNGTMVDQGSKVPNGTMVGSLVGEKTQTDIINSLQMPRRTYLRYKRLANLIPELMELLDNNILTMADAEKILKDLDADKQRFLYYKALPAAGYDISKLGMSIGYCLIQAEDAEKFQETLATLGGVTLKDYIRAKEDQEIKDEIGITPFYSYEDESMDDLLEISPDEAAENYKSLSEDEKIRLVKEFASFGDWTDDKLSMNRTYQLMKERLFTELEQRRKSDDQLEELKIKATKQEEETKKLCQRYEQEKAELEAGKQREIDAAVQKALAEERSSVARQNSADDHDIIMTTKMQIHNTLVDYVAKLPVINYSGNGEIWNNEKEYFDAMRRDVTEIMKILDKTLQPDIIDAY